MKLEVDSLRKLFILFYALKKNTLFTLFVHIVTHWLHIVLFFKIIYFLLIYNFELYILLVKYFLIFFYDSFDRFMWLKPTLHFSKKWHLSPALALSNVHHIEFVRRILHIVCMSCECVHARVYRVYMCYRRDKDPAQTTCISGRHLKYVSNKKLQKDVFFLIF